MTYSIGPITLRNLTNHTWSTGQISLTTDIQSQPQIGYIVGQEMVSYNLIGSFFADTAAEARIQRQQINDIIANPNIQQVYITFDQDDEELSGWFVIDSLETTIEAAIFNHYPFTLSVRRIQGGGALTSQVWKSNPYIHSYVNLSELWVAMPNGRGNLAYDEERVGGDGASNLIKTGFSINVGFTYDQAFSHTDDDIYLARCQIYDTITGSTTSDPTDPDETAWIERFGTYVNFEGDVVIGNNLIRYIWEDAFSLGKGGGKLYVWTGSNWEIACDLLTISFFESPTLYTNVLKPTIEYFDFNKVIWHENYLAADNRNVSIRYKILRGSYTMHVSIKSDHGNITAFSGVSPYSGNSFVSYDENLITSNYRAALATTTLTNQIKYGFFYTDAPGGGGAVGSITFGYNTSEGIWTHLGFFAVPQPIPNSVSLATLGKQYLANMNFQETIINPVMMI